MNILLPYSEIKKYLETDCTAEEFQKYLSLCGPSIERIEKVDSDDYVFDIEITTNRMDSASIAGIVQEASAILPNFGKKGLIRDHLFNNYNFKQVKFADKALLKVKTDFQINPRFTACVLENIQIAPSPSELASFLRKVGIRSINNVVDISNYLMILFGQPVHIFDYDKIAQGVMDLRLSKKGEQIITLDDKTYTLPGGDIVIADGKGRLIDLCGIMGGKLSCVDEKTKRVVLFVQGYYKNNVRRTSLLTGARSQASSYFEKGLGIGQVEPTFVYGLGLLQKMASGKIASQLVDLYEKKAEEKKIMIPVTYFREHIGIEIPQKRISQILQSLGFKVEFKHKELEVSVPFWRVNDCFDKEDLVEEVARIYGYREIPSNLPPFAYVTDEQIRQSEQSFIIENRVKNFLADLSFFEMYNYSMISREQVKQFGLPEKAIEMNNPMSKELVSFRQSLAPSLVQNALQNRQENHLKLFELANVYLPQTNNLPIEKKTLGLLLKANFFELKGYLEALFSFANIKVRFENLSQPIPFLEPKMQYGISIDNTFLGYIGVLNKAISYQKGLPEISLGELDFNLFAKYFSETLPITQGEKTNYLIEELTLIKNPKINWQELTSKLLKKFPNLHQIEYLGEYKEAFSLRLYTAVSTNENSSLVKIIDFLETNLHFIVKHQDSY